MGHLLPTWTYSLSASVVGAAVLQTPAFVLDMLVHDTELVRVVRAPLAHLRLADVRRLRVGHHRRHARQQRSGRSMTTFTTFHRLAMRFMPNILGLFLFNKIASYNRMRGRVQRNRLKKMCAQEPQHLVAGNAEVHSATRMAELTPLESMVRMFCREQDGALLLTIKLLLQLPSTQTTVSRYTGARRP